MWKDYSVEYIRKNRASSISVMIAAFISALFLSLLCSLGFNLWNYELETIILEEGDWQGRIAGEMNENELTIIKKFANVEKVEVDHDLSEGKTSVLNLYFQNKRTIYQDMPLIADKLGLDESTISYHELLLSRYMIHNPQDETPPLLLTFYLLVLLVVSFSLVLIIHNSFAVSMNARIHQFGIFSSIGATPGQIRICVVQEAMGLCSIPILLGSILGIAGSAGMIQLMNVIAQNIEERHEAVFQYHPVIFILTVFVSVLTVLFSAWIPAHKLSKCTPLQAIKGIDEGQLRKKKHSRILALLFGIEGELAGNALKAQKKALRTSTLSLTLSFLGFTIMLCFFTLSDISTNHTYFERYQDVWDIMITLKDKNITEGKLAEEIRKLPEIQSSVAYQKAEMQCRLPKDAISEEVMNVGGIEEITDNSVEIEEDCFLVKAPVIIMDDTGFAEYCEQIGITPKYNGSIVLNRIWDSVHSNFRYKEYLPFIKSDQSQLIMQMHNQEGTLELPVLTCTQEPPVLREEYANYTLVQIIPVSVWEQISEQAEYIEPNTYIRVLGNEKVNLETLNKLETDIENIMGMTDSVEIENRIREKKANEEMQNGLKTILGGFCVLLALIGIANVFSNTLGFLRQRKREFARYVSVGMTPGSMKKMFCIEALVIAGRPLLITVPCTVLFVGVMISASYLNPTEFLERTPIIPILSFILLIWGCVALAYYIGGKRMLRCNLTEALRNDTM